MDRARSGLGVKRNTVTCSAPATARQGEAVRKGRISAGKWGSAEGRTTRGKKQPAGLRIRELRELRRLQEERALDTAGRRSKPGIGRSCRRSCQKSSEAWAAMEAGAMGPAHTYWIGRRRAARLEKGFIESFNGRPRECLNVEWFVSLGGCSSALARCGSRSKSLSAVLLSRMIQCESSQLSVRNSKLPATPALVRRLARFT